MPNKKDVSTKFKNPIKVIVNTTIPLRRNKLTKGDKGTIDESHKERIVNRKHQFQNVKFKKRGHHQARWTPAKFLDLNKK